MVDDRASVDVVLDALIAERQLSGALHLSIAQNAARLLCAENVDPVDQARQVSALLALLPAPPVAAADGEGREWHYENLADAELLILDQLAAIAELPVPPEIDAGEGRAPSPMALDARDRAFAKISERRDELERVILAHPVCRPMTSGQYHFRHKQECDLEVTIVVEGKAHRLPCPICRPSAAAIAEMDGLPGSQRGAAELARRGTAQHITCVLCVLCLAAH